MRAEPSVVLAPEDCLLRRVLHQAGFLEWHDDFNSWVPTLAGVRFDSDGMSAFIRHLLEADGSGPQDVRTLGGTNEKSAVVYEFDAEAVTDAGYGVGHTPNDETPIGYAHASIFKPDLSREAEHAARKILASKMYLVHGTVDLPKPPGA